MASANLTIERQLLEDLQWHDQSRDARLRLGALIRADHESRSAGGDGSATHSIADEDAKLFRKFSYLRTATEPPVISELVSLISRSVPISELELAKSLRDQRYTTGLLSFDVLLRMLITYRRRIPFLVGPLAGMQVVVRTTDYSLLMSLNRIISDRRRLSVRSVGSIVKALPGRVSVGQVRSILDAASCVVWLDGPKKWFAIRGVPVEECQLQREVAKIACESGWLQLEGVAMQLRRHFPAASKPDARIVVRAILEWDWLIHHQGCIKALLRVDPAKVFRPAELAIYRLLRHLPQGMARAELVTRCELEGFPSYTTYREIRQSPFLIASDHGRVFLTRHVMECPVRPGTDVGR